MLTKAPTIVGLASSVIGEPRDYEKNMKEGEFKDVDTTIEKETPKPKEE